jgi:hypothetical protein
MYIRAFRLALLIGAFLGSLPSKAQVAYAVDLDDPYNPSLDLAGDLLEDGDKLGTSILDLGGFPGVPGGRIFFTGLRGRDASDSVNVGAVALSILQPDRTLQRYGVIDHRQITELETDDCFGNALATPGDLDGDGIPELLVGTPFDSVGLSPDVGALYVVFLDSFARYRQHVRITNGKGGLPDSTLSPYSRFGIAMDAIEDLDGDGLREVLVGAPNDEVGGVQTGGTALVLFLRTDGTVRDFRKIDPQTDPILASRIEPGDYFGSSVSHLGKVPGTEGGVTAIGSYGADGTGRVHLLRFNASGFVNMNREIGVADTALSAELGPGDAFGYALSVLGDLDGDSIPELVVAAPGDDDNLDGVPNKGAVYLLYLDQSGKLDELDKISQTRGGFKAFIDPMDFFACSVSRIGDLDSDGLPDLLIGARNTTRRGINSGTFYFITNRYCRPAGGLEAGIDGLGNVTLSWDPVPRGQAYLVQFRQLPSGPWQSDTVFSGTVWGNDTLDPGETYDWRVFSACGDRTFSYASSSAAFTLPLPRAGGLSLAGADRIRLPADFAAGETLSCHAADGRLLGTATPGPGPALWTLPAAWRGPGLRFVRRATGDALALPPSR